MSKRKLTTKFEEEPLNFGTGMWNVGLTPNVCRCTLLLPTSCIACLVGTGRTASGRWPATYVSCDESAVSELKRYASFIATSNHSDLLSDPSGSRASFVSISPAGSVMVLPSTICNPMRRQCRNSVRVSAFISLPKKRPF